MKKKRRNYISKDGLNYISKDGLNYISKDGFNYSMNEAVCSISSRVGFIIHLSTKSKRLSLKIHDVLFENPQGFV